MSDRPDLGLWGRPDLKRVAVSLRWDTPIPVIGYILEVSECEWVAEVILQTVLSIHHGKPRSTGTRFCGALHRSTECKSRPGRVASEARDERRIP